MERALYNTQQKNKTNKQTKKTTTHNNRANTCSIAGNYTAVYDIFAYRGELREHIILYAIKKCGATK